MTLEYIDFLKGNSILIIICLVDHEARYYQNEEEDIENEIPQEYTRLLRRSNIKKKSHVTTLFISFMSLIFIFGMTIGVYLLIEQGL